MGFASLPAPSPSPLSSPGRAVAVFRGTVPVDSLWRLVPSRGWTQRCLVPSHPVPASPLSVCVCVCVCQSSRLHTAIGYGNRLNLSLFGGLI